LNVQAAMVRAILEKHHAYEWTVQGFGFIRTKLADVGRIHVWNSRLAVPKVSTMHTHPWPLKSTIISGELINQRFRIALHEEQREDEPGMPYLHSRIKTGEGGGLIGDVTPVEIVSLCPEVYIAGQSYEQAPYEIHRSIPQDGTVTLLERPQGPPLEEASVFWPAGTEWVSAEPRVAYPADIRPVIEYALNRWAAA